MIPIVIALSRMGNSIYALQVLANWSSVLLRLLHLKTAIFYCCVPMVTFVHSTAAARIWAIHCPRERSRMASCVAIGTIGALIWPLVAALPRAEMMWLYFHC